MACACKRGKTNSGTVTAPKRVVSRPSSSRNGRLAAKRVIRRVIR